MSLIEAQKFIEKKDFGKALDIFLEIEKKDPNNEKVFFYLGLIYFELNNYKDCIFYYNKFLKKNPNIAVLGLNPHCETIDTYSEENNIIIPSIKNLKKKGIKISGPFSADTFFINPNYKKFDLVIGMYHDQVLTPIKSIFKFNAINITAGLPFVRVSPDHGPNEKMISKNISDPTSIIQSILFFERSL